MDVTVLDMMNARDRRAEKQRELLGSYGQTLLCFTMNIPGPSRPYTRKRALILPGARPFTCWRFRR